MASTRFGSRSSPPPAHLRYTTGAGQPRLRSTAATGYCCNSRAVRTSDGMSLPIICAMTGRPVGFSVMDLRMFLSSCEVGVNAEIFGEINVRAAVIPHQGQNGRSVTSCIGASARMGAEPASIAPKVSRWFTGES